MIELGRTSDNKLGGFLMDSGGSPSAQNSFWGAAPPSGGLK